MELWLEEIQKPDLRLGLRARTVLHREISEYQEILVVDTFAFGRALMLDGTFQVTEKDEFVYHEMLAHVPLMSHPAPQRVLVVGGGDGGTIREVVKHPSVQEAVLCEIDPRVTAVSREFLPSVSAGLSDLRVKVLHEDGIAFVENHKASFDVILIDSTDPVGPAVGLYSPGFYATCKRALRPGGIVTAQSESPFVNGDVVRRVFRSASENFERAKLYLAPVPTYPSGLWSFTAAADHPLPQEVDPRRAESLGTRYYTPEVHRGAFSLPPFAAALVE